MSTQSPCSSQPAEQVGRLAKFRVQIYMPSPTAPEPQGPRGTNSGEQAALDSLRWAQMGLLASMSSQDLRVVFLPMIRQSLLASLAYFFGSHGWVSLGLQRLIRELQGKCIARHYITRVCQNPINQLEQEVQWVHRPTRIDQLE